MKPTAKMIEAGAAVIAKYNTVEDAELPTVDAMAEQIFGVMDEAREPGADEVEGEPEPFVDPFDFPEAGLSKMDGRMMQGQLRDHLLDVMRTMPNVWQKLKEEQKRALAKRCNQFAATVVFQAAHKVAGMGYKSMGALLKEVKFGEKGTDIKVAAVDDVNAKDPLELDFELVRFQGKNIVIVFVDPATYNENAEDAKIEPDEPALPMEGTAHGAQAVDVVPAGETEKPLADADEPVPAKGKLN